jgi:phosphatidylglycerophosphate synthase
LCCKSYKYIYRFSKKVDFIRKADSITFLRVLLTLFAVYLIFVKFDVWAVALLLFIVFWLDWLDGVAAAIAASGGGISFIGYIRGTMGDKPMRNKIAAAKKKAAAQSGYGPRLDIAGDRAVEYILWFAYLILGLVPLIVVLVLVAVHSYADAMMGSRGTSSKMRKKITRIVYSSHFGRYLGGVLKAATFIYLAFVYITAYPVVIGDVLIAVTFAFILLRGAVQIYENMGR